ASRRWPKRSATRSRAPWRARAPERPRAADRRVALGPGAELLLDERHPLYDSLEDEAIAERLRRALDGAEEGT
ncbi:MAG TPA: hypothetical protein VNH46_04090, partial [Gemmatimonadales bacterium]|nr:hypothetical protein [Gemmatimonadales bacterium]